MGSQRLRMVAGLLLMVLGWWVQGISGGWDRRYLGVGGINRVGNHLTPIHPNNYLDTKNTIPSSGMHSFTPVLSTRQLRTSLHPWARSPLMFLMPKLSGRKRAPFSSWAGKRSEFVSAASKRSRDRSWAGKRPPFSSWAGKRKRSGNHERF